MNQCESIWININHGQSLIKKNLFAGYVCFPFIEQRVSFGVPWGLSEKNAAKSNPWDFTGEIFARFPQTDPRIILLVRFT